MDKESTYYFSKTINSGKPRFIWQGKCDNSPSINLQLRVNEVYTLDNCNSLCNEVSWCTHFVLGKRVYRGLCFLYGDGC